jgi:hypothetical protein
MTGLSNRPTPSDPINVMLYGLPKTNDRRGMR